MYHANIELSIVFLHFFGGFDNIAITNLANSITDLSPDVKNLIDVYTLDGRVVKKRVQTVDAIKGLSPGLYVIGREKIFVK